MADIQLYSRLEDVPGGALEGYCVVVDVLRFSTTVCSLFDGGAASVRPVKSINEALEWKDHRPSVQLVGEQDGKHIPEFDYVNSPVEIQNHDFSGAEIVALTSNGTRALQQISADTMVVGGTVNARAVGKMISNLNQVVHLVACGSLGEVVEEDQTGIELIRRYAIDSGSVDNTYLESCSKRIWNAKHARELVELGYSQDVEYACCFNRSQQIPVIQDGILKASKS